jgi:DNA polymerase-2
VDRGFILHSTYRTEGGRPVIHLFGVSEQGQSFVVRDTRMRPSFFLATADLPRAEAILNAAHARLRERCPELGSRCWRTLAGDAASEVFLPIPSEVPSLRETLRAADIDCHEADIPFATRYLIDRGIRGALRIDGPWRAGRRVERIYEDVDLAPDDLEPELRVMALDIETDPQADRVHSFSLYAHLPLGGRVAEVHAVVTDSHKQRPGTVETGSAAGLCYYHPDEGSLLQVLLRRLREIDPDVLTGWNVVDFDLRVLEQAFARCGVPFHLGRADLPCRIRPTTERWATSRATLPGRAVIDGLSLLRSAFVRLDDYSLDTAARTLLGEGKSFTSEDRGEAIEGLYREDLPSFLAYNLTDSRLVVEILEKLGLIPMAVRRVLLTGLPIDRVGGSIAAFDFLYLGALHKRDIVGPSVQMLQRPFREPAVSEAEPGAGTAVGEGAASGAGTAVGEGAASGAGTAVGESVASGAGVVREPEPIGGHVLDPVPGLYDNIWLFDYRSLYPSIIRTFQIDPLGFALAKNERDAARLIQAPNGALFLREEGILPSILGELLPKRVEAKQRGDMIASTAIKILMNSFYGVLATSYCRFHSTRISNAITTFGQKILLWTKERLDEMSYPVIYGDTDSVFAISGISDAREAQRKGGEVVAELNESLARWVRDEYDVESHLMLEFEKLFLKFFMPAHRHSKTGSKKRHAGLIQTAGGRELVVTGLESVRRDWTVLAKDFQRHLLMKVFKGETVDEFVADFVRQVREGERDGDLVYRKALRKPLEAYGKTTPPHVKAARLMQGQHGRVISYVMTTQGPQPLGFVTAPLDYEHYVEKQLRPIAEAILVHAGSNFDEALGKGGQLGLL